MLCVMLSSTTCRCSVNEPALLASEIEPTGRQLRLIRTVCFVPRKESPNIFSKLDLLHTDTPLIQTLFLLGWQIYTVGTKISLQ